MHSILSVPMYLHPMRQNIQDAQESMQVPVSVEETVHTTPLFPVQSVLPIAHAKGADDQEYDRSSLLGTSSDAHDEEVRGLEKVANSLTDEGTGSFSDTGKHEAQIAYTFCIGLWIFKSDNSLARSSITIW